MRLFHVTIHARSDHTVPVEQTLIDSTFVDILSIKPSDLSVPFNITFDAVAERLQTLDRVFFEPDGSFVWVSSKGRSDWQLDGLLTDGRSNLMTVELKGKASWNIVAQLLNTLDWPAHDVVFQDMHRGLFLGADAFREFFAA